MGKSTDTQWIPSGGVLVVAIAAAVLAAILVNVYIGYAKSEYALGSQPFYRLTADVAKGEPVRARDLESVPIPKTLVPAFEAAKFVTADAKGQAILDRRAPRNLRKGEFLRVPEFMEEGFEELNVPKGYELFTIPISADSAALGQLLQPGRYVTIRGEFDTSPDPKKPNLEIKTVMENVQVKALGGSTAPVAEKARTYDKIQIQVRSSQVKQLEQIQRLLTHKQFTISLTSNPEGASVEPEISREVLPLIERPRGAPTAPLVPLPPIN